MKRRIFRWPDNGPLYRVRGTRALPGETPNVKGVIQMLGGILDLSPT